MRSSFGSRKSVRPLFTNAIQNVDKSSANIVKVARTLMTPTMDAKNIQEKPEEGREKRAHLTKMKSLKRRKFSTLNLTKNIIEKSTEKLTKKVHHQYSNANI
jgi:hypothetical protein